LHSIENVEYHAALVESTKGSVKEEVIRFDGGDDRWDLKPTLMAN